MDRSLRFVLSLAGAAAVGMLAGAALLQPEKTPAPPAKPAEAPPEGMDAAQMEAAMKAMMPGPMHELLGKYVGQWQIESAMEMPGSPAEKSKGTAVIKAELGGRFLHESGSGEAMGMAQQSFKMVGYNNGSRKFESVWTWTMGTGFLYMSGESRDDGKTINWKAWFDNESGEREDLEATTSFIDADHFTVTLSGKMPDGSPGPTMTETYSRTK